MFDWTAFEELGHKVAGLDARAASDGDLFDATLALERVRAQIDAAQGSVLAELDARGACDREFGLHANQWLAGEAHLARSTATARLKVGR